MENDKLYIRNDKIDDVEKWWWIADESGLWTGPRQNWENSHKEKILKYVTNRRVVVQAGGGAGMYPRLLSNMFNRVYSFEIEPSNFQCLVRNVEGRRVWCYNAALGDVVKMVTLRPGGRSNRGTHKVNPDGGGEIPQLTIDTFPWDQVDFIWLDVEGYEGRVLNGAARTIDKFKPVIFAEGGRSRCREYLESKGYEMVDQTVSDTIFIPKK